MDIIIVALVLGGIIATVRQLNRNARRNGMAPFDPRTAHHRDRDRERMLHDLTAVEQLSRTPLFIHQVRGRADDPDWIARA